LGLQTFLSEGHVSYWPHILRTVLWLFRDMQHSTNKFFVNKSFLTKCLRWPDEMAPRAVVWTPLPCYVEQFFSETREVLLLLSSNKNCFERS